MDLRTMINNFIERFREANFSKHKKSIFLIVGFVLFLMTMLVISNSGTKHQSKFQSVSLMPRDAQQSKKDLNYEFIKLDTIKMPSFTASQDFQLTESPEQSEPITRTADKIRPELQPASHQAVTPQPSRIKSSVSPTQESSLFPFSSVNRNPNMIVTNNLGGNQEAADGSPALYSGKQSALIKVMLPNRTPVANGSLVEARVLRDSNWGNLAIPRRTKLIGVASLMNRRVDIEFREIIINNESRSCNGRAYDLKQLKGLAYSPLSSEAKRILVEELRDAVSGVPIVGRAANRAAYTTNYYDQDVSELEEGLEFYVLIESVY